MLKSPYDLRPKRGGDDPEDKKGKMPKKTCGDGSKPTTTKYGAPTGNEKFQIGAVVRLAFNSSQFSFGFEFQVEHFFPDDDTVHLFWLTWEEMNSFPQYQNSFWFYLRNNHVGDDTFEEQVPSRAAVALVTNTEEMEEVEEEQVPLPTAGSVVGRGHTVFADSDDDDE